MAFSYDMDSGSDRDRVRIALANTTDGEGFTDEEIDDFLARGGTVEAATALALRTWMAHHAMRGDVDRVAALDLLRQANGDLPTVRTVATATLPMDRGYTES